MDEFLFRSGQQFESFQYKFGEAALQSKRLIIHHGGKWKDLFITYLNSPQVMEFQNNLKTFWEYIIQIADEAKCTILYYVNPRKFVNNLQKIIFTRWSRRDVYIACIGLLIGGIIGIAIGVSMQKPPKVYRHMQAVQCSQYCTDNEYVVGLDDTQISYNCACDEILISVKAASIQFIDAEICRGYGRTLRRILPYTSQCYKNDLPITLGRDCSGVVTDVGPNVTKFDVGDEVWLTSPFWAPGTLSQYVLAPQHRVGKKPDAVGFEGACTLAFAGSVALNALESTNLTKFNSSNKRIFIQGGSTPVGCVLIQLLNKWGAHITTNCYQRANPVAKALGANDLIIIDQYNQKQTKDDLNMLASQEQANVLLKELELRDPFDVIINTKKCGIDDDTFKSFTKKYHSTVHKKLISDSYNSPMTIVFYGYLKVKAILSSLFGHKCYNFHDVHICHKSLDMLNELVENGELKTLIDKIFHPADIVKALNHIESNESIGSTIITFR